MFLLSEKENLCLYGLPSETWEVNLPVEEVPPELPEPALGINFARDGMQEKDWLSLVAVHSDSWLLSVAFYFGARFGFGKSERYYNVCYLRISPSSFTVLPPCSYMLYFICIFMFILFDEDIGGWGYLLANVNKCCAMCWRPNKLCGFSVLPSKLCHCSVYRVVFACLQHFLSFRGWLWWHKLSYFFHMLISVMLLKSHLRKQLVHPELVCSAD